MRQLLLLLAILCFGTAVGEPPTEIPPAFQAAFTHQGTIPVSYWYFDDSQDGPKTVSYEILSLFCQKARAREWSYNGELDHFIFQALDSLSSELDGKEVCLMGSFLSWYEG